MVTLISAGTSFGLLNFNRDLIFDKCHCKLGMWSEMWERLIDWTDGGIVSWPVIIPVNGSLFSVITTLDGLAII